MNSKILIGCLLLEPKCIETILEHVRPDMLDDKMARQILQAAIAMNLAGEPIEAATLNQKVTGMSAEYSQVKYLCECMEITATAVNVEFFAKQQYEYWAKKKLREMHVNLSFDGTLNETLGGMAKIISDFELDFTSKPKQSGDAGDIVNDYLKYIDDIKNKRVKILQCNTPGLYNASNPPKSIVPFWIGGLYVVVSSYSSAGKSAFLANIAAREAEAGANVVIFSNEMGRFGYADRFAGYYSDIPYGHILYNKINDHQSFKIDEAFLRFSQLPIKIYDRVRGVVEIKNILRKLSYQQHTDIVIVDYLQNLVDKASDVKAQLDTSSKGLMQMAQDMDLSVIAASQIDNASAKGQNTNNNFMAPKGSGDIAADADVFIEMTRDTLNSDERKCRTIDFAVKKNRPFSKVGRTELFFNRSFTRIGNEYEE